MYDIYKSPYANYLAVRFHFSVRLVTNKTEMTLRTKNVTHEMQLSVSLMYLPHFDICCDLLLYRPMETWNLFVLYDNQEKLCYPFNP